MSDTWNSSKQIEAPALGDPRSDEGERVFLVLELRELDMHVAHERMEMESRLAADRHGRVEASIRKLLPRPTPPHR